MNFEVHSRLLKSSIEITKRAGCRILLKDNCLFPWFIIVPEVADGVEDLHQLSDEQFTAVMNLVREVSRFVESYFKPEKLNVACIGNQVRQMHLHVVGRSPDDPAWPEVVWSCSEKESYPEQRRQEITAALREWFPQESRSAEA
jgi:diadenosine tetraphosphate (Ap4A) HIT family hydrolase